MRRLLKTTINPAVYHGHGRRPPFFEGWYFKLISADGSRRHAIIPGVFLGDEGHAFVQVLDGVTGRAAYHSFPLDDFRASADDFLVRVGPNRFSGEEIELQIDGQAGQINGRLRFRGRNPWPVSPLSPGIMGWYAWVPWMECYHGVLSLDHHIEGTLEIDGRTADFSGGRGYMEKDWGQAFPAGYVWFQTNHFGRPGVSITGSIAIIPWLRGAFPGFIVGVLHERLLYRFATYTGARTESLQITDDHVKWVVRDRQHRLEMLATRSEGGLLLGPNRQTMGKRVDETLNATVTIRLNTLAGREIFSGEGRHAGLEVHGDLARLLALQK